MNFESTVSFRIMNTRYFLDISKKERPGLKLYVFMYGFIWVMFLHFEREIWEVLLKCKEQAL